MTATELAEVASRAERAGTASAPEVAYLGSLMFADDDVVLCLFEGPSRATVRRASEQAAIPWERLMASTWVNPSHALPTTAKTMPLPASSRSHLGDQQ